jgi:DNA-binding beta-propeller fold protein YncE
MSIEAMPDVEPFCDWATPASAHLNRAAQFFFPHVFSATPAAIAALQDGEAVSTPPGPPPDDAARLAASQRKPLRIIQDRYPSFSSVAVDPIRNEVVLTDENLFQVMVYDRLANTPPTAATLEPKRVLGGLKTKIEFQVGLYVDPPTGDIYAVNNDTVDTLVVFSRQANGNVAPNGELFTPHGTFGIAVDEGAQEMYITEQHDSAVVVFKKTARNHDSPVRILQGDRTRLADPHGIALDPKNRLVFVTNHGSVHSVLPGGGLARTWNPSGERGRATAKINWPIGEPRPGSGRNVPPSISVYTFDAHGDIPPARTIEGPNTRLNWPTGIAFDPKRDELHVANDQGDEILVFSAAAHGNVAPLRVLKGPKTLIKNPTGVALDTKNDELWVANFGNHTATVYKPTASGDAAPLRVIRSAPVGELALMIGNPGALAYDTKREELLAPN